MALAHGCLPAFVLALLCMTACDWVAGAGFISQALKEHTNERLMEIDLGYNEIKDEGACAVAQVRLSMEVAAW